MLMTVWDIETTDLLKPGQKIIEIHADLWDFATRRKVDELYFRIDPKRSIAPSAEKVHHISLAMLAGCPVFGDVAAEIVRFMERGALRVAHNGDGFDGPFLDMELATVGLPPLSIPSFDTMLSGRFAKPDGSVPNLGALAFALGVDYDPAKAHAAAYDDEVLAQCFFRGVDWGWFKLDGIVDLHALAA